MIGTLVNSAIGVLRRAVDGISRYLTAFALLVIAVILGAVADHATEFVTLYRRLALVALALAVGALTKAAVVNFLDGVFFTSDRKGYEPMSEAAEEFVFAVVSLSYTGLLEFTSGTFNFVVLIGSCFVIVIGGYFELFTNQFGTLELLFTLPFLLVFFATFLLQIPILTVTEQTILCWGSAAVVLAVVLWRAAGPPVG